MLMWCSSSSPNAGKTVPDVGLTGIMARTSPPVLHRFIDELSFWDSPSSADKAKDKRFNTKRRNVPFYQQALEERGSCDSMVDEAETSPTLSPSSQSASVWKTAVDKTSGRVYYYDSVTRRTQWGKPEEIRSQERRRKQERRRRDRKFFDEMEANILKALERGEMIPGVPNSQTPKEGPPQEPLAHRKPRVRTISGMDDVLLAELRDDSNVKRQDHHQHVQIPVSKTSPVAAPAAAASTTVGRPPLPRPPSSKSHITANDDMVLSPDPVDDDEAKHPFQNQQQRSSATDLELAGEKLLDAPIHSEWTECVGEELGAAMATLGPPTCHTRRNTGGTIYLQNTMTNPDIKATIRCVCAIIRAHIAQAHSQSSQQQQCLSPEYLVFKDDYGSSSPSKRKHPPIPSLAEVNDFYDAFYRRSQMEHDTIITSLIYVERLIKDTNGALTPDPENWHSVLFACMVLASKVWDDLSMWNVDFSNVSAHTEVLSSFTLARINQLELELLKRLKFDVKVPASEYAKYYFLIRTMLLRSGLVKEDEKPLGKRKAFEKLETMTRTFQDEKGKPRTIDRRVKSMDATFSTALSIQNLGTGPVLQDTICLEQLVG